MKNTKNIDRATHQLTEEANCQWLKISTISGSSDSESDHDIPMNTLMRHAFVIGNKYETESFIRLAFANLSRRGISSVFFEKKEFDLNRNTEKTGTDILTDEEKDVLPMEIFSLEGGRGVNLKAGVADFGPLLFGRMIAADEKESDIIGKVYKYCSDKKIPAVDLKGFVEVIRHLYPEDENLHGEKSRDTDIVGRLIKKIEIAENAGAGDFLGERVFEVEDFIRIDKNGNGVINKIELQRICQTPLLYTTFMLQLLTKLYLIFPEQGRINRPKLVVYLPDCEELFLMTEVEIIRQLETVLRGLEEKGVGVFFGISDLLKIPQQIRIIPKLKVWLSGVESPNPESHPVSSGQALLQFSEEKSPTLVNLKEENPNVFGSEEDVERAINASHLTHRYNEMQELKTAYQIVLTAIAEQAQNGVVPHEDFVKTERSEKVEEKESRGISKLIQKILRNKHA